MSAGTQVKPNLEGLATGSVAVCLGLVFLPKQGAGADTPCLTWLVSTSGDRMIIYSVLQVMG